MQRGNPNLLRDPAELARLIAQNAREGAIPVSDASEWLANPRNFALVDGDDLSLFEAKGEWPGPLEGHIFFASRGKEALAKAKAMLAHAFSYGATCIEGRTPHQFRDALMFARLLGFKVCGRDELCTFTRLTDANTSARTNA